MRGSDVDADAPDHERTDHRDGQHPRTGRRRLEYGTCLRVTLGQALERERRATMHEGFVASRLADTFRGLAACPCAVGVGPDAPLGVRSFDRAHEHDIARRALIHRSGPVSWAAAIIASFLAPTCRMPDRATNDASTARFNRPPP